MAQPVCTDVIERRQYCMVSVSEFYQFCYQSFLQAARSVGSPLISSKCLEAAFDPSAAAAPFAAVPRDSTRRFTFNPPISFRRLIELLHRVTVIFFKGSYASVDESLCMLFGLRNTCWWFNYWSSCLGKFYVVPATEIFVLDATPYLDVFSLLETCVWSQVAA